MNYLIPNYVVRGGGDTTTIINDMLSEDVITESDSDKVLLIFKYLFTNTTQSNTVNFTLEDMITDCGFVLRKNKGSTNDKFKSILNYLNKNNYFDINDYDFLSISPKAFIKVGLQYFSTDAEGNKIKYFMLSDEDVESIYSIENVDSGKLLLYFATLKSRIYTTNSATDEKAQVCYATVVDMAKDISLSESTIDTYNNILVDNGLIYIGNAGKFTKLDGSKRIYTQSSNTYTLTSIHNHVEEVDKAISSYIDYMRGFSWNVCKDTTYTKQQLAGTISRLEYLEREGRLTEENKIKLTDARVQQNVISDTKIHDNKELLEKYKDKLLSEIFDDLALDNLCDKYFEIENNIGLVHDGKLQVDKEYYNWVIVNYNEKEHDYYKNMVTKRIRENIIVGETEEGDADMELEEILDVTDDVEVEELSEEDIIDNLFTSKVAEEVVEDNIKRVFVKRKKKEETRKYDFEKFVDKDIAELINGDAIDFNEIFG